MPIMIAIEIMFFFLLACLLQIHSWFVEVDNSLIFILNRLLIEIIDIIIQRHSITILILFAHCVSIIKVLILHVVFMVVI